MTSQRIHSAIISIDAADGHPLVARVYEPTASARATVLALPGIGLPQRAFRHVATWLSARGVRVVTFDYRSIGEDTGPGAKATASLTAWATLDAVAALETVTARYGRPWILTHSFGGQALALDDRLHDVEGAILVASQLAPMSHWRGAYRLRLELMWRLTIPFFAMLGLDLPARVIGHALAPGVALEWRSWGLSRDWLLSKVPGARERLARFDRPVWSFVSDDDEMAPVSSVDALLELMPNADVRRHVIAPVLLGRERLGHLGLLRPYAAPLWNRWLGAITADRPRISHAA